MRTAHCLVVARAPVPGQAKTRLAADLGEQAAAEVAAAALLDTLEACCDTFPRGRRHLALVGDLARARRAEEIRARLGEWHLFAQHGSDLGARLAHAHRQVGGPVVQVGMDTPQLAGGDLDEAAAALDDHDAVLGPADDGGWWLLALRDPRHAEVLAGVPTSTTQTAARTVAALRGRGLEVALTSTLRDVDVLADGDAVARAAPRTRFAATWVELRGRATP